MGDEFRTAMEEWVELKKQLTEARKDLKILNKREKDLGAFIKRYMKNEQIDIVKVQSQKVSYKKRKVKGALTREVIKKGLLTFFGDDEARAEGAFQAILDAAPETERDSITLSGKA